MAERRVHDSKELCVAVTPATESITSVVRMDQPESTAHGAVAGQRQRMDPLGVMSVDLSAANSPWASSRLGSSSVAQNPPTVDAANPIALLLNAPSLPEGPSQQIPSLALDPLGVHYPTFGTGGDFIKPQHTELQGPAFESLGLHETFQKYMATMQVAGYAYAVYQLETTLGFLANQAQDFTSATLVDSGSGGYCDHASDPMTIDCVGEFDSMGKTTLENQQGVVTIFTDLTQSILPILIQAPAI